MIETITIVPTTGPTIAPMFAPSFLLSLLLVSFEVGDGVTVVSDGIKVDGKKLNDDCEEKDNGSEIVDDNTTTDDVGPDIVDSMTGSAEQFLTTILTFGVHHSILLLLPQEIDTWP